MEARSRPLPPLHFSSIPWRRRRFMDCFKSPVVARRASVHQFLEMSGCQGQMLLSALALSLLAACVGGAPHPPSQTKHLQLLKSEDPSCSLLLKLLLELVALRGEEMPRELEEEEELGGRERLMRRRLVRFTQRERKAGCRNFFWKSFTSC